MKPVKIAMIGNRHDHAPANFTAIQKHPEAFDLVGLAEMTPSPDDALYRDTPHLSLSELLMRRDLEAVIIEAGKEHGIRYAQMFAERGLPVFLDKPGSTDIPGFERFMNTMKQKRLPVQMGYMYRFNPMVERVMEMVKHGELGEIFSVEAQMSVRHDTEKRRWLSRYTGGTLFYLGCHLIDAVCRIMGFPEEILPLSLSTGNEDLPSEDLGCAVLKYPRGLAYIKASASEYNGFDRRQLVICGTRGTVEIRPWEIKTDRGQITRAKVTLEGDEPPQWADGGRMIETEPYERYDPGLLHFARLVRGEAEMQTTYEYEIELFRTIVRACGADKSVFRPEFL